MERLVNDQGPFFLAQFCCGQKLNAWTQSECVTSTQSLTNSNKAWQTVLLRTLLWHISVSNTEMAAILADMAASKVPALSPIKSPERPCEYHSPVTKIPDAEPAPKKHKADENSKSIWNHQTTLETRRAECKQLLQVLREHATTACSTDQNHTSGLTKNSTPPCTRSVTEPIQSCLPLWSNSKNRI